jgi:hypothetical protein
MNHTTNDRNEPVIAIRAPRRRQWRVGSRGRAAGTRGKQPKGKRCLD